MAKLLKKLYCQSTTSYLIQPHFHGICIPFFHEAHCLFQFQVHTVGIIPQVGRGEVDPEVGGGGLPVFGKRDGGPAGRAGAPRQRLHLGGVGGIETNDMYPVVIVSR